MRDIKREFRRHGNADVDVMFDSTIQVRCPSCTKRFRVSVSRRPIEVGGMHRLTGACDCGRVHVTGTVAALFETVPGMEENAA